MIVVEECAVTTAGCYYELSEDGTDKKRRSHGIVITFRVRVRIRARVWVTGTHRAAVMR